MAITFPATQDSFGSVVDNVDTISASHVNDMRRGVEELEENDLSSGWLQSGETWTFATASTFTISGDKSARYAVGHKLRLKQGGSYKYYTVLTAVYVNPTTTVTVVVNTDYTLANAGITDNWFSSQDQPYGWPSWFNYTPTGGPTTNATLTGRFKVSGRHVTARIHIAFTGTPAAWSGMPSLPITAAVGLTTYDDGDADLAQAGYGGYFDNGTATVLGTTFPGVASSATTVNLTTAAGANWSLTVPITWTTSDAFSVTVEYEI